jgi:hypothetical protein
MYDGCIGRSFVNLMRLANTHKVEITIHCSGYMYAVTICKDFVLVSFYISTDQAEDDLYVEKFFFSKLKELEDSYSKFLSDLKEKRSNLNTCVCCGEPIPEGRIVCPGCECNEEALT